MENDDKVLVLSPKVDIPVAKVPATKKGIREYVDLIKSKVIAKELSGVEAVAAAKILESLSKSIKTDYAIKDAIADELDVSDDAVVLSNGVKVTKQNRASYDFTVCEDDIWDYLTEKQNNIKESLKAREAWLKTLKVETPDPTTGIFIKPPVKIDNDVYIVTLPKE